MLNQPNDSVKFKKSPRLAFYLTSTLNSNILQSLAKATKDKCLRVYQVENMKDAPCQQIDLVKNSNLIACILNS